MERSELPHNRWPLQRACHPYLHIALADAKRRQAGQRRGSDTSKTASLHFHLTSWQKFTRSNEPLARGLQNEPIGLQHEGTRACNLVKVDRPKFAICEIRISRGGFD
jgi:hypothetical protein